MFNTFAAKIEKAASEGQKIAMFHLLVLQNADDLEKLDPLEFCRRISVPDSYETEFRKMLALRKLMREKRIGLSYM